jgi:hypothetical protein
MSTNDRMTIDERLKYLLIMKKQYVKASREGRSKLLDQMVAVTGYDRKYVIHLLGGNLQREERQGGRGRAYGTDVDHALWVIYEALDYVCAERLTPNLVWMATQLGSHGELEVNEGLLGQLERISISTVERRLSRMRQDQPRLPRRPARREKAILRGIPMVRLAWDLAEPGHFEVDLVHQCGLSTRDLYMCTLQWIDVATGWSERRAVLGRGRLVMEDAFRCQLGRLPFEVLTIHPDNDSAFFNDHLLRFWARECRESPCRAPVPTTRTTILGWSRRTARSYGTTWAMTGWIPSPTSWPPIGSMTACGSTTICFSR